MYKNLVLCSGDLKGFIILGYLKTIENDIKNIKEYIGCSVGTIINFFLLINYSIDEIYKIFKDEFNEFLNLIQNEYDILNNIDEYLIKLYFNNGLLDMNILNKILTKHLKIKLNKDKLTFIECAKLYGKNFITTVSNITKHKLEYCDINNTPELNIIDEIIAEPVGGAHRNREEILSNVKESISKNLNFFANMSPDEILNHRKNKFLSIGRNDGFIETNNPNSLISKKSAPLKLKERIIKNKNIIIIVVALLFILTVFIL